MYKSLEEIKTAGNRRKIIIVIVVAASLLTVLMLYLKIACSPPSVYEKTVKAPDKVFAEGVLLPARYASLNFESSGIVEEILAPAGKMAKKGEILVRLRTDTARDQYEKALELEKQAKVQYEKTLNGLRPEEVEQKRQSLLSAQASYKNSAANYDRWQQMWQKHVVAQKECGDVELKYEEDKANLAKAEAEYKMALEGSRQEDIEAAKNNWLSAKSSTAYYKHMIDHLELKAPFDGTVVYTNFKVGEYAVTGSTNVISADMNMSNNSVVQFGDTSSWQIQTSNLSQTDVSKVSVGMPVSVTMDALPNETFTGTVTKVDLYGTQSQGDMTYMVYIALDQADPRFRWNMKAKIAIDY